ncbi:bst1 [Cucurbita argyrosperma subsp. argyrosperma]|nr:bst1 [Cucurbita argyrosperma subsp. argyrosperma]
MLPPFPLRFTDRSDTTMQDLRAKIRITVLIAATVWISIAATYGILKPIANGCIMTYMYPTYIPISSPVGLASEKYGVYLYHEGWKKIDFKEHLKKLNGVPVLFIPGNGGSYKQARSSSSFIIWISLILYLLYVRSLAAESDRAYQGGPLEHTFYQEASIGKVGGGTDTNLDGLQLPDHYTRRLDWFAVDLEGEHSAMDGGILEEHAEYVVHAIHRILDQYKESFDARAKEGAADSGSLPSSVILVGHSMGGFVARAAVVHSRLRKSAVETVLTLSSPHQ